MVFLKNSLKAFVYLLAGLMLLLLIYSLYVSVVYRDISNQELLQRYPQPLVQTVMIDGVNLHYQQQGEQDAPVLLLLHSHYFTMRMWDEWLPTLAQDYRVIRYDMTSHGLTGPDPRNNYSMVRSQQLLEGLLSHLNIDKLSIVGSSFGGNVAFTFAANHPERVSHLVLMNSGGLKRKNARSGTVPSWVDTVAYLLPRIGFDKFLKWVIADDRLVTDELVAEFHDMFRREGNRVAELNRIRQFDIGEPGPVLAKVKAPTLIMWGKENPQLSYQLADVFVEKLTAAKTTQTKVYEGVGHVIPLEIPLQGASDVMAFIQSNPVIVTENNE